jgi:CubicO group peptidase (beta-lactamase class C family)
MKNKLDSIKFVAKYFIIVIILIGIIYLIKQFSPLEKAGKRNISDIFNTVDPKIIDSLMSKMTLEEKVYQLIIFKTDSVNSSNIKNLQTEIGSKQFGGIFFNADSLKYFYLLKDSISSVYKIIFFSLINSKIGFPSFSNIPEFDNLKAFSAVTDDKLKNEIYTESSIFTKNIGTEINILTSGNENSPKTIEYKSIFNEFFSKNILLCLDEKSLNNSYFIENKEDIIKSGLPCLLLNDSSKNAFRTELKEKLHFSGIKILDLSNVSKEKYRDTIIKSIKFGVDLLMSNNPALCAESIISAISNKQILETEIDFSVKRILAAKYWTKTIENKSLKNYYPSKKIGNKILVLFNSILKKSISIIKNSEKILPLSKIHSKRITVVTIGNSNASAFIKTANSYKTVSSIFVDIKKQNWQKDIKSLGKSDIIIVNFFDVNIDKTLLNIIDSTYKNSKIIYVNYKNENNLKLLLHKENLVYVFGISDLEQKYAAELIYGGFESEKNNVYFLKSKSIINPKTRLCYAFPEEAGMNSQVLSRIDSIAKDAILRGVFPGCQVLVIKDGMIVYEKSFGTLNYSPGSPVNNNTLYDLASLTKITATTLAAMKMYDFGKMKLDQPLGSFFRNKKINYKKVKVDTIIHIDTLLRSEVKNFKKLLQKQDTLTLNDSMIIAYDSLIISLSPKNNIFNVTIRDLLKHQSGIMPVLPILPYLFYKKNVYDKLDSLRKIKNGNTQNSNDSLIYNRADIKLLVKNNFNKYYSTKYIADSTKYRIAKNLYFRKNYFDTLWEDTKALRVYSRKIYQYTDINMILLQQAIDSANHQSIDVFLKNNFYGKLGMQNTCYMPLKYFTTANIAPTEEDKFWRAQVLQGDVHDPSAAMLGGISGNAGLFSTAHDLGILGQMFLNGGTYGGEYFLKKSTIDLFSAFQEGTHRGLGFDKANPKSVTGKGVPVETYGHTGFTGTCMWIDPVNNIVYVFLSNRVYPNQKNWRINTYKIREKIQTEVYNSLE